jgi:hypothetical protein
MVAKTIKKAQKGAKTPAKKSPPMRVFTEADYRRKDSVPSEMFPGTMIPRSKSNYHSGEFDKMFEKPKPKSAPKKKMKSGGTLGMKSVKAGYDKNPGVTRADIIVAAKGQAKYGKKVVKKSK